jgi:hypothetical protein
MATSVLPKPTSPQTTRSIGRSPAMSATTAAMASCWSAVSSKGKAAEKARYSLSSDCNGVPLRAWRRAYRSSSSAATSRSCSAARRRALAHWSLPSLCSGAASGDAPV